MEVSSEDAAATRPNLGERGISSSQTLSSGLHVQSELVNEIAQLRSALSQANHQLERAQAAGYVNRSISPPGLGQSAVLSSIRPRDRRSTLPAGLGLNIKHSQQQNGTRQQQQQQSHASNEQRHRRVSSTTTARSSLNGTTSPPATASNPTARAASATAMNNNNMQTTPMRSTSKAGYLGAPPSSLAVVSTPPTSASTLEFSLKRDLAYDNLAGVSNAPSPRPPALQPRRSSAASSSGLGISSPAPHTRNTSISGTPTSSSSKANMSVIPQGSVGTATTLAGGSNSNSPRTPQFQSSEERSASNSNNDTPSRAPKQQQNKDDIPSNVLRDTTNGAIRESRYGGGVSDEVMDKLTSSSSATLSPPPVQGHQQIDTLLSANGSPSLSSDGEYSSATTATTMEDMEDDIMVRLPMRKQSKASAGASTRGGSSPFFGGSAGFTERHAARIASSQSGTSKVIMSLQTELTNSRTQLESTRTQLRASARAVESLTRQIEDLKEGKERSRLELQGLTTTLTRRERMLEETLSRARTAESNSKTLEEEKKLHYSECTRKMKDLEGKFKEADEKRLKMESEYNALRSATNGLSDGWRKELKTLKKELASAKLGGEQARNDARTRQQSVTKLLSTRTSAREEVNTALIDMQNWRTSVSKQYENTISDLKKQNEKADSENQVLAKRTMEVLDELRQYKNAMRAYDDKLRQ